LLRDQNTTTPAIAVSDVAIDSRILNPIISRKRKSRLLSLSLRRVARKLKRVLLR